MTEPAATVALDDERWAGGRVRARGGATVAAHWFGAVIWTILAGAAMWGWVTQRADLHPLLLWGIPLFAAVAPLLVFTAVRETLRWRRFRGLELALDPFPGSLGGHVGGSLELPCVRAGDGHFTVTLACVRTEVRGRGEDRSRWEKVLWSRDVDPAVESAGLGVRLRFTFELPADLPPSEPESDAYVWWTIRVRAALPGADLDQTFEVPVLKVDPPLTAAHPALAPPRTGDPFDLPAGPVTAERHGAGVRLVYPRFRQAVAGVMMTVFGAVFLGGGLLAFGATSQAGGGGFGAIFVAFGLLFLVVFGLVGGLLLLLGLFTLFNRLTVEADRRRVVTVRSLLFPLRHEVAVADLDHLELRVNGQTGQGARATVSYELRGVPRIGRRHLALGDGIEGSALANAIAELVSEATGLEWRERVRGDRGKPGRLGRRSPGAPEAEP
ncbi:MAG: hypothetical protein D6701_05355 [Gemmatimonadetes bacterium]|nr:MAG: hypothetical protein D6701_05355 [Gemmatimonadota bacterium]